MGRTACTEPQCLYKGTLYLYLYVLVRLYNLLKKNNTLNLFWNFLK